MLRLYSVQHPQGETEQVEVLDAQSFWTDRGNDILSGSISFSQDVVASTCPIARVELPTDLAQDREDIVIDNIAFLLLKVVEDTISLDAEDAESCRVVVRPEPGRAFTLHFSGICVSGDARKVIIVRLITLMDEVRVLGVLHADKVREPETVTVRDVQEDWWVYDRLCPKSSDCRKMVMKFGEPNGAAALCDIYWGTKRKAKVVSKAQMSEIVKMRDMGAVTNIEPTGEKTCAIELIALLNRARCADRIGRMNVGVCLHNVFEGNPQGLDLWMGLIPADEKGNCLEEWSKMQRTDGFNLSSLKHWASTDSPDAYKAWKDRSVYDMVVQSTSITGGITDIALVSHLLWHDQYICSEYTNKLWYEFSERWVPLDDAITFSTRLTNSLKSLYNDHLHTVRKQIGDASDDVQAAIHKAHASRIVNLIKNIKNPTFKTSVIREASTIFYNPKFEALRDSKLGLFGFEDGVFDAEACAWRKGDPADNVTMTCGYNFPHNLSWQHPSVVRVLDIFEMIFPDPLLCKFNFVLKATRLKGGNPHKIFGLNLGNTNGGKTVSDLFDEQAFGEYFARPPIGQIIHQPHVQDPSAPTAANELIRHARILSYAEPKRGSKLDESTVKIFSSGADSLYSRNLYQKVVRGSACRFTPAFIAFVTANSPPAFDGSDTSMLRRMVCLWYRSEFVDPDDIRLPPTRELQKAAHMYPKDTEIYGEVKSLAAAYMWVLVQHYAIYRSEGLVKPEIVDQYTERVALKNDPIKVFLEKKVVKTIGATIDVNQLFVSYAAFYRENYPCINRGSDPNMITSETFKEIMVDRKRFVVKEGKYVDLAWSGEA